MDLHYGRHIFTNNNPLKACDRPKFLEFPCASLGMVAEVPKQIESNKAFDKVDGELP
jgi:hypothetical protein